MNPDVNAGAPSIAELLAGAERRLHGESPRLDAELLLAQALGHARSHLHAWPERTVDPRTLAAFESLVGRRAAGEPLAYILGEREFWSLSIAVTPDVLIPRPETELLVELALERLPTRSARIADLGTGSGAVAVALAYECPGCEVVGTDASPAALAVARSNAERHGLGNLRLFEGRWFEPLADQRFDLVVSNPPYVAPEDPHLEQGDLRFEPRSALVAADEGLADLYLIVDQARDHLTSGAWLLLEHGFEQGEAVTARMQAQGYREVSSRRDLAGHPRVSLGRA
jgi:release factor glutamine methyltransferase